MFWNKPKFPLTTNDQEWTEDALLWIEEQFGAGFLKTVSVKTPSTKYFNRKFKGTEEDADFALKQICEYMSIDSGTLYLSFYGQEDIAEKHQLTHNVQSNKTPAGLYTRWPEGYTEISLNLRELSDPVSMIATLAHELAHVKLLGEKRIAGNDEPLTDLLAVAFGFGIFTGNSVFNMRQWQGIRTQGWSMRRRGYLPEQIIAYAMAWMARYQNDITCAWKQYLNKTMIGYFEACQTYIQTHPDKIRFEKDPADLPFKSTAPVTESKPPESISYEKARFGQEPDDNSLPLPDISGHWKGVLQYGMGYGNLKNETLSFQMDLNSAGEDEFEGLARDIAGAGLNEAEATVKGFREGRGISFVKQYKYKQLFDQHGNVAVFSDQPGPEIQYTGEYNHLRQQYEGTWLIEKLYASSTRKKDYSLSGTWQMKKDMASAS